MKVTTILGSPKKKGNTAKVFGMFEAHIAQDHEVERINIVGKYVLPFCTTPEAIGASGAEIANKMVKDILGVKVI